GDIALRVLARQLDPVGAESYEPLPRRVGGVEMDGSGFWEASTPERAEDAEVLVDAVGCERGLDGVGRTARVLGVPAVHRGLLGRAPGPEADALVEGHPRPARSRRVRGRELGREHLGAGLQPVRNRLVGRGFLALLEGVAIGRLVEVSRHPAMMGAEMVGKVTELPLRARRHRRLHRYIARCLRGRAAVPSQRRDVVAVLHAWTL